jgi:hypothetical protein
MCFVFDLDDVDTPVVHDKNVIVLLYLELQANMVVVWETSEHSAESHPNILNPGLVRGVEFCYRKTSGGPAWHGSFQKTAYADFKSLLLGTKNSIACFG